MESFIVLRFLSAHLQNVAKDDKKKKEKRKNPQLLSNYIELLEKRENGDQVGLFTYLR